MHSRSLSSLGIRSCTGSALGGSWTVRLLSTTGRGAAGVGLTHEDAWLDALRSLREATCSAVCGPVAAAVESGDDLAFEML